MGDYSVQIKIRNKPMLDAMAARGIDTPIKLAKLAKVHATSVCLYVNLKKTPQKNNGEWRSEIITLADFLQVMPQDLFPAQHIKKALKHNILDISMSLDEVMAIETMSPEQLMIKDESALALNDIIDECDDRTARVIRGRFGIGCEQKTLQDIGDDEHVTRERVRQIEAAGISKIKKKIINRRMR